MRGLEVEKVSKMPAKYCYPMRVKEGSNMLKAHVFVATISAVSMVLQPVAYGQAQKNWAAQALKQYVRQNQRGGKSVTVREFWNKNKAKMHPDWQKKFFPAVNLQKDERLPRMDVISVKGPGGTSSARLILTLANKKTISVEFLGGESKFARVNGQNISYEDFYHGEGLMQKLTHDPVIKAESQRIKKMALKSSIVPSYALFRNMTAQERADYFLNLRIVVQAAGEVTNRAFERAARGESASFIQLLLEKAYANNLPQSWVGKRCIIAGYVGNYVQDREGSTKGDIYCDHTKAISNFAALTAMSGLTPNKTSESVYNGSCSSGSLRCNPFVYGFDRGSGSTCVKIDRHSSSYQQATRTCDKASPLRPESLAADSEAMIKTLLGKENKAADTYFKDGKVISEEKYNELMNTVVKDFDTFISEAIGICGDAKNLSGNTNFGEKNQGDACTVLKNRKLAFEEGFGLLKGKYEKPTPVPAPPVTQPPIADEGQCKTADGSPGFYDSKCRCLKPGEGEAGPTEAPEVKNGKCTPAVAVVPAPVPVKKDDCSNRPQMDVAADRNGKMDCVPRSADLGGGKVAGKDRNDRSEFDCSIICPVLVGGLFLFAAYKFTKSNQHNNPGTYVPPVPGPLPAPPPQPTPITEVPAIVPTLPIPNPAGSETPSTATPSPTTGVGTR